MTLFRSRHFSNCHTPFIMQGHQTPAACSIKLLSSEAVWPCPCRRCPYATKNKSKYLQCNKQIENPLAQNNDRSSIVSHHQRSIIARWQYSKSYCTWHQHDTTTRTALPGVDYFTENILFVGQNMSHLDTDVLSSQRLDIQPRVHSIWNHSWSGI